LTAEHDAYRWICGGVKVNHHTLADFRVGLGETLDGLLTEGLVSLMAAGVVTLKAVAQDGMRVRASAGAGSFRRQEKLEQHLEQARSRVERKHPTAPPINPIAARRHFDLSILGMLGAVPALLATALPVDSLASASAINPCAAYK
jgi:hypothetical protein